MSWMVSGWMKNSSLGSIARKAVMLVIADYCTEDAEQVGIDVPEGHAVCWAGIQLIAARSEASERTVRRVLDDMEAAGVIRRERRQDNRGWRLYDLIWVEYARPFADLSDWVAPTESDKSHRTESPLGRARVERAERARRAVDNPPADVDLPDSHVAPSGLSRPVLADSDDRPPHPPIRNNHQVEPPPNHQDHLREVTHDRARASPKTRSSSDGGPAPPATGEPQDGDSDEDRRERYG